MTHAASPLKVVGQWRLLFFQPSTRSKGPVIVARHVLRWSSCPAAAWISNNTNAWGRLPATSSARVHRRAAVPRCKRPYAGTFLDCQPALQGIGSARHYQRLISPDPDTASTTTPPATTCICPLLMASAGWVILRPPVAPASAAPTGRELRLLLVSLSVLVGQAYGSGASRPGAAHSWARRWDAGRSSQPGVVISPVTH